MDHPSRVRVDLHTLDLGQVPVLSMDQIHTIRSHNDYVDQPVTLDPNTQSGFFSAHDECGPSSMTSYAPFLPQGVFPRSESLLQHALLAHLSRSSTVSSSMSRTTSGTSDQRLLAGLTPSNSVLASVVHTQPEGELKPEATLGKGLVEVEDVGPHRFICEECGRCKCRECCAPHRLPSCWACGQRCLCSVENAVEYGTCLCCVKAVFYHCAAKDDEDDDRNCADRPCACTTAHACARWSTMGTLALCLPCLCCYPLARLCLITCQHAHDHVTRPGCRCSNTNTVCRKMSATNPRRAPSRSKSLEQPV